WCNIQREIREIQELFQIPDERVGKNELLLATIGQSQDLSMMAIYVVALILAFLVAIAGILMITGSLNSNIAQRTAFFGMLRCLGATQKQIVHFVRREALYWCRSAVPVGVLLGTVIVWMLSALLRLLSPRYFGGMPYFGISWIGIIAGSGIGVITVFLAAGSPAKKAAGVSPLTAVSGNASEKRKIKKAANTHLYSIETALGIHHAKLDRKNFILMSCSFAFSIILFLTFSVAVDFMKHAVKPLKPSAPDISIVSVDNTCSIDRALTQELMEMDGVKRAYGRSFFYDMPIQTQDGLRWAYLISYEDYQLEWAKDSLIDGSLSEVIEENGLLAVYHGEDSLTVGENVTVDFKDGENMLLPTAVWELSQVGNLMVSGILSDSPFDAAGGQEILICSGETFAKLTGERDYTVIDVQLTRDADNNVIQRIRDMGGENIAFSDRRLNNEEVRGAMWSFRLFIYGFLGVIALICAFHIMNSIAMSVSVRIRQYGAMRAVGMDSGQMFKMVAAEAIAYGAMGVLIGCGAGVPLNWFCFEKLVTFRWGTEWYFPAGPLCVIVALVAAALALAIYGPAKRIRRMSVVDTISGR
ncbi:MAG: ABC transporter permease, partial [Lachnospiraceae bacterium]|nr:ABC transporter permease [Lachnospiraceae bacterium]